MDITTQRLEEYVQARMREGASRATCNRELSGLRRGFSLAIDKGLLSVRPKFPLCAEHNAREGFFEDGDFAAVLLALPAYMQPVIRFLRLTGWRVTEALTLTWDRVDWEGAVIRLTAEQTKGKRARLFPFAYVPELKALLDTQWKQRDGLFVFQCDGQRLSYDTLQHRFQAVCKQVGVARTIHDLRRTFARDMRRAGVSEGEIMALAGWRTRSMFDRYNVIDEQDLARAVAKRYANGNLAATSEPPAQSPDRVSSSAT